MARCPILQPDAALSSLLIPRKNFGESCVIFFVNEVNHAKTVENLSDSKITEIVITDKIIIPVPGNREIIPIPELGTDYHIENPLSEIVNDHIDENHPGRNAYVFTSYKHGFLL